MAKMPRPRDDLAGFPPYRTAPAVKADVRLAANEWAEPNPASQWLTPDELNAVLLNRYPTAGADLRAVLAERYGVTPDQIVIGNGSNDTLLSAFIVFGGHGRKTLLFQPTYSMHERLTTIAGGTPVSERIGWPYIVKREQALRAMERHQPEIVVFTTPNNPTGNEIEFDVILAVAKAYPETLVLVDEAYSDFAGRTILPSLPTHPNVVVSKTFSKVLASAGLRIGVLVMHPELAETYRAPQIPNNVSSLSLAVALKIAKNDAVISSRVLLCTAERGRVMKALSEVDSIEVHPSTTNFVLFRLKDAKPAEVHARFLEQGVLIRDVSMWPANEQTLRVSIGTPAENDRFIAAIRHALPTPARA
ncbi:MAG TPA: aminotransferase class I/II-fold pyridoxal phosphate-dependent enzyme [Candidatus Acidoferrales bacterium]|nr:aminotransferase class I/II-fold pyridoxal phosphate-dependent enzyme [Candidatus Acidoferrales bacterium]